MVDVVDGSMGKKKLRPGFGTERGHREW